VSDLALKLSDKYKSFFKFKDAEVEVLEGQTAAGKTTVGAIKFIYKVIASKKKQHGLCGLDIGTVEKNIINKDLGLLDFFGDTIEYHPNGHGAEKMAHLTVHSSFGDKIIYVFGYNDTTKWKKALGGQLGCLYIDEVNIADIDFVREAFMRADYKMVTLNPDDPNLPVYSEYINHSRPLKEFEADVPEEMMSQLLSQPAYSRWVHWFFKMNDNAGLPEEKKRIIIQSVPVGSKLWKNKIIGLRGRAEGLVYSKFERKRNVIELEQFSWLPNETVYQIIVGLDSGLNADATAAIPIMLTTAGRLLCLPSFYYLPKLGTNASSQQAVLLEKWLDYWLQRFNVFQPGIVFIVGDSAALTQDMIYEINLRTHYTAAKVGNKDIQKDTQRTIGIIEKDDYLYIINAGNIDPITYQKLSDVDMFIIELENKVWDRKKGNVPEDGNDHCIDAFKYGTYYIYYGGA
jgi:hypothetical protein